MYAHATHSELQRSSRRLVGTVISIGLLLLALAGAVVWRQQHFAVLSLQSASMAPLLQPGDAVVVRQVPLQALKVGDIVSYHSATAGANLTVTHRITAIDTTTGRLVTQGDENVTADPSVAASQVIGRAERRFSNVGYVLDFLHSPQGLAVVVYAPALIVTIIELRRLTNYFKPSYQHHIWLQRRSLS